MPASTVVRVALVGTGLALVANAYSSYASPNPILFDPDFGAPQPLGATNSQGQYWTVMKTLWVLLGLFLIVLGLFLK